MKRIILLAFLLIPVISFAQEEKDYKITSYQVWTLWQDTIWIQTESVDDCDFSCHVHFDSLGLWGKFVLEKKIYHVYSELERKEIDVDNFTTTYYGKGKLVYENSDIEVIYWEKMFDLYAIRIELDDKQVVFQI